MNSISFNFIKAIADAYKNNINTEEINIEGKVKSLKVDQIGAHFTDESGGFVSIEFLYEDRTRSVKVYLEGDAFQQACDALKHMKLVSVYGTLDKSSKFWHLDNPRNFMVID